MECRRDLDSLIPAEASRAPALCTVQRRPFTPDVRIPFLAGRILPSCY